MVSASNDSKENVIVLSRTSGKCKHPLGIFIKSKSHNCIEQLVFKMILNSPFQTKNNSSELG